MPELPETETIARDLDAAVRGDTITGVEVERRDVLRQVRAPALARRLTGRPIVDVSRRAKSIVITVGDDDRLVVTPRFTGTLLIDPPRGTPDDGYTCLRLRLGDGRTLRYRDVRRLGTVALLDARGYEAWQDTLGPEPLDPALDIERFSGTLRGSRRAVKSILMDQRRLAGVGNIYANEACWHAGVRPSRRGTSLTRQQCDALLASLRMVLTDSIALRGTTFRDFRDAYGARGGYAARLAVYGRAGEPCRRCGAALASSHAIDGRATTWCAACQR
jgi:formamidopyrimidine-DNA glycosylase